MKRYKLMPGSKGFIGKFAARMMFQRDKERMENKRLREALEKITTRKMSCYLSASHMNQDFIKIARQALEGDKND